MRRVYSLKMLAKMQKIEDNRLLQSEGQAVSPELILPIHHRAWLNGDVSPHTGVTVCYFICTKHIYSHNVIFLHVIVAYRGDLS
jgi:hypothetical protein